VAMYSALATNLSSDVRGVVWREKLQMQAAKESTLTEVKDDGKNIRNNKKIERRSLSKSD
jgi:hypothetical protein